MLEFLSGLDQKRKPVNHKDEFEALDAVGTVRQEEPEPVSPNEVAFCVACSTPISEATRRRCIDCGSTNGCPDCARCERCSNLKDVSAQLSSAIGQIIVSQAGLLCTECRAKAVLDINNKAYGEDRDGGLRVLYAVVTVGCTFCSHKDRYGSQCDEE